MNRLFAYIKLSLILLCIFAFISISTIFYTLWRYSPDLPSYESIVDYKPNLSSRIYSSDGLLLKSFFTEERIFIPENRIPKNIKNAFLASEDKNFYDHYGIDIFAILRAKIVDGMNTPFSTVLIVLRLTLISLASSNCVIPLLLRKLLILFLSFNLLYLSI